MRLDACSPVKAGFKMGLLEYRRASNLINTVGWLLGCGLTSHSVIFQLYSDGTVVQFSKFWPAAEHPTPWAAGGILCAEPTPIRAPGHPKTSLTSLPTEGPHALRLNRESNPGLLIHSPARYLYTTATGLHSLILSNDWFLLHFLVNRICMIDYVRY